jgi:hypothetical protein
MSHNNRFAYTPEKRAGQKPDPARHTGGDGKDGQTGLTQETDKSYGGGRWGQRTPKTASGGLSHGDEKLDGNAPGGTHQGHGRDYNTGSDEQRFISKTVQSTANTNTRK